MPAVEEERMRGFLPAAIAALALLSPTSAEDRRGLSQAEIGAGLRTAGRVAQLDGGRVIDELRVSADGTWILFTVFGPDIRNNEIWMLSADGSTRRKLDAPYGYKNTPVIRGGHEKDGRLGPPSVYVSLAGGKQSGFPDGIYRRPLEGSGSDWMPWEAGSFRDLALSEDESYLAASSGTWNAAVVRSTVRVWRLGPDGATTGSPYSLAPELQGQVHRIAFAPDNSAVYFECTVAKPGSYYGVSNLYRAANRPGAPAELLFADASQPSTECGASGLVLYFRQGSDRIMAWEAGTGRKRELAVLDGLHPNGLARDRANGRLLLGIQAGASVAGLLAIWID
jgi:hypothetical protein